MKLWQMLCSIVSVVLATSAQAVDGVSIQYGDANQAIDTYRLGVQWQWTKRWFTEGDWALTGHWDASIAVFDGDGDGGQGREANDQVTLVGVSPVLRYQPQQPYSWGLPYIEAGIGVVLLSETSLDRRQFGSAFQFEDRLAIGWRFGPQQAYDLKLGYTHYSNASIKEPNAGLDSVNLTLGYWF